MRVFLTGASGFVGSAIIPELLGAGHQVLGLARSDAAAETLAQLGAQVHRGELTDTESLAAGARACDGVIHCAFIHDFTQFAQSAVIELAAVSAMGDVLAGSDKPLIITSGTAALAFAAPGKLGVETDASDASMPRIASEVAVLAMAERGVRGMVIRLPPSVHGDGDHGFVPTIIAGARESGHATYVGDGQNRWPAVHRLDAAHLYRLALENGAAGTRYHAVGDGDVPTRQIAELIGRRLGVPAVSKTPEETQAQFGFIGMILGLDCPASSALTEQQLGWRATRLGLIADLEQGTYFDS